jgi:hypothetical protein
LQSEEVRMTSSKADIVVAFYYGAALLNWGALCELTRSESESGIGTDSQIVNQTAFDAVCTCTKCNHGLVRDCLKASCICCKGSSHSMILDGMEGFPPSTDEGIHLL